MTKRLPPHEPKVHEAEVVSKGEGPREPWPPEPWDHQLYELPFRARQEASMAFFEYLRRTANHVYGGIGETGASPDGDLIGKVTAFRIVKPRSR